MRVFGKASDAEQFWTSPFPREEDCIKLRGVPLGITWRLLGGDMLSPHIRSGVFRPGRELEGKNFFTVIPIIVTRMWVGRPGCFFFSLRVGRFGFYVGHKVFGVDSAAYRDYPLVLPEDVYEGSRALSGLTCRFSTSIGVKK